MMRNTFIFVLLTILITTIKTLAQDFDGDSIYYTPIPTHTEKQGAHKSVFHDSIMNDQRFAYFFNLQVGTLIGCNNCSAGKEITFTSSTTHGIAIGKKLRAGAGIGLDSYYSWNTMPMFGSVNWDLIGTKNTNAVFVQFNYGWAEGWRNKSLQDYGLVNVKGGRMSNILVGYRVKYHDIKVSLSVGAKFQRVHVNYEYPTYYYRFDGTMVQGSANTTSIQQDMSRLMFAMTVGWK